MQISRPDLVGTALVLRTPTHSHVHRRYEGDEFYDRVADPAETRKLIDLPESAALAGQLREQLFGWLADTSGVIPREADPRFPEIPHGWRQLPVEPPRSES